MAHPQPILFTPSNPDKYVGNLKQIVARSSWELKVMRWMDNNPSVLIWNSEECVVPYYSEADGKWRRYFVDFIVKMKTNEGVVIYLLEIKPHYQTVPPKQGKKRARTYLKECYTWQVNQDKWKYANAYAKEKGMEFKVLTEYDIGIANR